MSGHIETSSKRSIGKKLQLDFAGITVRSIIRAFEDHAMLITNKLKKKKK